LSDALLKKRDLKITDIEESCHRKSYFIWIRSATRV